MVNISHTLSAIKEKLPNIEYRLDEPMKNNTSFKIGGTVSAMFFPKEQNEIAELSGILNKHECPALVIGNGTNLLFSDSALEIIVINTTGHDKIKKTGELTIEAGAGISLA